MIPHTPSMSERSIFQRQKKKHTRSDNNTIIVLKSIFCFNFFFLFIVLFFFIFLLFINQLSCDTGCIYMGGKKKGKKGISRHKVDFVAASKLLTRLFSTILVAQSFIPGSKSLLNICKLRYYDNPGPFFPQKSVF